jgi:hypothetical protein
MHLITCTSRTTETWLSEFGIPECLKDCTRYANANDGCAYDDFACHNINYQVYSDVRYPTPRL